MKRQGCGNEKACHCCCEISNPVTLAHARCIMERLPLARKRFVITP